jgi:hypothetical protein
MGCVIMAVYNAYRVFIKQTTATPPEIIPWRGKQEQRFLQVGNWMAAPRYAHRATIKREETGSLRHLVAANASRLSED